MFQQKDNDSSGSSRLAGGWSDFMSSSKSACATVNGCTVRTALRFSQVSWRAITRSALCQRSQYTVMLVCILLTLMVTPLCRCAFCSGLQGDGEDESWRPRKIRSLRRRHFCISNSDGTEDSSECLDGGQNGHSGGCDDAGEGGEEARFEVRLSDVRCSPCLRA